jgi:transcriptional regulator with XRE-family HTH domain
MIPSGNIFTSAAVESGYVRDRPNYYKDLAAFLVGLRTAKKWNQSRAVSEANRKGLTAITRQILLRMEKGQIKDPDVEVLQQLAQLYGQDERVILNSLLREKYRVEIDLLRQTSAVPSGETDVLHVQIAQLQSRYDTLLREFSDIAATVFDTISRGRAHSTHAGAAVPLPDRRAASRRPPGR